VDDAAEMVENEAVRIYKPIWCLLDAYSVWAQLIQPNRKQDLFLFSEIEKLKIAAVVSSVRLGCPLKTVYETISSS